MATLPPSRGRRRRATGHEGQQSKGKVTSSTASPLPSWCSGFRKESLDSERAYDERVTTSTQTSEIRLRQESMRYWNRFLQEAEAVAFRKIVGPTCHHIKEILWGEFGGDSEGSDESENENQKQKQQEDHVMEKKGEEEDQAKDRASMEIDESTKQLSDDDEAAKSGVDGDWKYCEQLFGLPSASPATSTCTPITTRQADKNKESLASSSASMPNHSNPTPLRMHYPFEVLPIFVITSPLISNCLQDRSRICHSMWRELNGLEGTIGTQRSSSSRACGSNWDEECLVKTSRDDDRTICLYLPRLLSSLTETLQVLWDGLVSHYENTHDAPSMDPDDPRYYSNPNELASKRHSYHVSKRRHYEALLDRKVTTESQKTKIGTKKQQSLQDFILEFLQYVYEEPEEFSRQERGERERGDLSAPSSNTKGGNGRSDRNRPGRGNLILLLEDPRILHPKVTTTTAQVGANSSIGASGKPNNSNLVQSQLLETLAAWRGRHGIPVSLVVFHAVGSKHEIQESNVLLNPSFESSANGGRFGIQTVRCSIPSPSPIGTNIPPSMAFGLWSHYFLQATMGTPMPLLAPPRRHDQHTNNTTSAEIVLQMCRDALKNESSCTKWVSSIRARLASNFYTRKGSFVWDALNPNATAMIRAPPLFSETRYKSEKDIATDNATTASNSVGDKNQKHFVIGNDDVQIFQPEFVAWFCSYHKAHTLLTSQAGDHKAGMTLSDKCEALLKCHWLLRAPTEPTEQEKPPKCRKLYKGDNRTRDGRSGGSLQFWWSISCSLLPLYFLSMTVANEGMMLSSNPAISHTATASGSRKRQNDRQLEGESRWVLERLANVYCQLLAISEESDDDEKLIDSINSVCDKTMVNSAESGRSATAVGDARDSVLKKSIGNVSDNNSESRSESERNTDFVETTLRRYLQRGIEPGGNKFDRNGDSLTNDVGATAIEEVHQRSIRQLTNMVREFIVLVAAFSSEKKIPPFSAGNKEDDLGGEYKIRLGMTETILEMNLLALGQVEAWTRRWIEFNPLMAATLSSKNTNEDCEGDHIGDPSYIDVHENGRTEGSPVNFRRRILENLPVGSRQLYEVLEGRLSIDRDDWYHSFEGTAEDFAIGVWTLRKCGLIRPKKTTVTPAAPKHQRGKAKKRQEFVSYEKVAVVWC